MILPRTWKFLFKKDLKDRNPSKLVHFLYWNFGIFWCQFLSFLNKNPTYELSRIEKCRTRTRMLRIVKSSFPSFQFDNFERKTGLILLRTRKFCSKKTLKIGTHLNLSIFYIEIPEFSCVSFCSKSNKNPFYELSRIEEYRTGIRSTTSDCLKKLLAISRTDTRFDFTTNSKVFVQERH